VHDPGGWCARGILKLNQAGDRFMCVCNGRERGAINLTSKCSCNHIYTYMNTRVHEDKHANMLLQSYTYIHEIHKDKHAYTCIHTSMHKYINFRRRLTHKQDQICAF